MLTAVIIGCSTSNQPLKTPGGTCGFKSTSQYVPGYVPARSETEAKTFCSISFALLNLLPTPRSNAFFKGKKKTKKTSRSHAVIYFYMKNHHEPTPRSNTFCMGNQQNDRVKTSPRPSTFFIGFKSLKITKMN